MEAIRVTRSDLQLFSPSALRGVPLQKGARIEHAHPELRGHDDDSVEIVDFGLLGDFIARGFETYREESYDVIA